LNALARILNEIDDPDQKWPSGETLMEAWDGVDIEVSLSKGFTMIAMARDPKTKRVGFDADSDAQKAVVSKLSGYTEEGAWGYVKYLGDYSEGTEYKGFSIVAQFQNDELDTIRFWLQSKYIRKVPEDIMERCMRVDDFSVEILEPIEVQFREAANALYPTK
jgi:hypothetical protein